MLFEFIATVSCGGASLEPISVSREANWRFVRLDSLDSLWLRFRAPSRCMAYDILRGILRQSERGIESCGSSFLHEIFSILHSFYAKGEVRLSIVFLGIVRSCDQWSFTAWLPCQDGGIHFPEWPKHKPVAFVPSTVPKLQVFIHYQKHSYPLLAYKYAVR